MPKSKGSLGRCGVLGWEVASAEGSLKAGSPSPRAVSIGFVLGTMNPPLYHLGVNVHPTVAPFVLFSPTLVNKGHGSGHPPSRVSWWTEVSGDGPELLLDSPTGSLLRGKARKAGVGGASFC